MTTLEEIETLLPRLNSEERGRLATLLSPSIQKTPGVNGGSARVGRTRIAVWTLEEARREGASDEVILEMYLTLSLDELEAAWRYIELNREEIERDIRENEKS